LERETLLYRLKNLEENIATLKSLKQKSLQEIQNNKLLEWSLRYGIFESIQIVIDISCHIANRYNLGVSNTYSECLENLYKYKYISKELKESLISAIGLRNILIHEYVKIDINKLYQFLNLTNDFKKFIDEIKEFI
jgi:uncharacterized protein YutE (UPF0331/DUF86 family)